MDSQKAEKLRVGKRIIEKNPMRPDDKIVAAIFGNGDAGKKVG